VVVCPRLAPSKAKCCSSESRRVIPPWRPKNCFYPRGPNGPRAGRSFWECGSARTALPRFEGESQGSPATKAEQTACIGFIGPFKTKGLFSRPCGFCRPPAPQCLRGLPRRNTLERLGEAPVRNVHKSRVKNCARCLVSEASADLGMRTSNGEIDPRPARAWRSPRGISCVPRAARPFEDSHGPSVKYIRPNPKAVTRTI